MTQIYPPLKPYAEQRIRVSDGHSLHLEQSGNPDGLPVLYLHGGPGGGISPFIRRLFNPAVYRLISFDQRGCGKSTPFLDVEANSTEHLLADIEHIRSMLGIEKWVVSGGSWGSTLALIYAIRYPKRVQAMILRGIFLARQQDVDWLLTPQGAAAQMFAEYYPEFVQGISSPLTTQRIVDYYQQQFHGGNDLARLSAARAWANWETRVAVMHATDKDMQQEDHRCLSLAILEHHYLKQGCFVAENYILENIHQLSGIPATLIHGRYDMVCKAENAVTLHQHWPSSRLCMVPNAGHSGSDPLIAAAFVASTEQLATFLQGASS